MGCLRFTCVCLYVIKHSCKCVFLYTFLRADRWENHRGIQHVWAFRGDTGQQPATPLFDFWPLMWCHSPSHGPLVWPGSSLGKGLRIKGSEMPSQYTISANEHFVMIFVLNWGFFFVLISSILASQHEGEIQGCSQRDSLTLPPSQRLCLIYSPRLPLVFFSFFFFFISSWVKLSQPCNPLGATSWNTRTWACTQRRRVCACL